MVKTIRVEKRQRGVFGWVFLLLFWAFTALMLLWVVLGFGVSSDAITTAASDAEQAGAAIGSALGMGMILVIWALGTVILGALVMLTRGKKIITEEVQS